jgi:Spy/CpxP family protein refolding chaperone
MNAFTVAAEMLGDLELTSGQRAQLRAINHKYFQEVYTLLQPTGEEAHRAGAQTEAGSTPAEPSLTAQQTDGLRAMLERDVRDLLTPAQRARLDRERAP